MYVFSHKEKCICPRSNGQMNKEIAKFNYNFLDTNFYLGEINFTKHYVEIYK